MIGGSIGIPKTLNRYGYCWGNPLILVDLDGRFPSGSEAGNAGAWTKHIMEEYIEDASQAFVKGVSDVKDGIARGISEMVEGATAFYEEHEEEVETAAAIAAGVAITAGVVIFTTLPLTFIVGSMIAGGVAGAFLGGSANVMTGGSFHNGAVGGAVNGFITTAGMLAGQPDLGYWAGGFLGNYITETLNDGDITDPNKPKKGQPKIVATSVGMGFTQVGLGRIQAIQALNNGAGVAKGSAAYWVAKFFGKNLEFTPALSAYILIDGLLKKYKFGEDASILLCN